MNFGCDAWLMTVMEVDFLGKKDLAVMGSCCEMKGREVDVVETNSN